LLKWKYCKTEETFLQYKRAAICKGKKKRNKKKEREREREREKRLREIKRENWKIFYEGTDKFTNPSYIWDRMKKIKIQV
jgi:hypothetical protein